MGDIARRWYHVDVRAGMRTAADTKTSNREFRDLLQTCWESEAGQLQEIPLSESRNYMVQCSKCKLRCSAGAFYKSHHPDFCMLRRFVKARGIHANDSLLFASLEQEEAGKWRTTLPSVRAFPEDQPEKLTV